MNPSDILLPEPPDTTRLVIHVGTQMTVIARNDIAANMGGSENFEARWFPGGDYEADPVEWAVAIKDAWAIYPVGQPLALRRT
ncbi:hypothetical protein ACFY05_31805 [Microtetraspora fusca]|uniref:Uncharacterized protein n=1 Tax=Microtetraspora fusca TaxID=1997 RepID=A0ABW6VEA9_MICFU